ncbi:MAG: SET domain-containing protein-lysine N-methyltransferase [Saprospiraceae bacterium]|nr:SET domain-containing protein-lysine N-methyltransferase [Candidatus Vicinibacter affinis]MBK8642568.1 SET domain-containing protein-lysine N-methyltransferase [Candidatus Vicinibacter affinis]
MRICVLQPDYGSSSVDYQNYDPRRDLSGLMSEATIDHVFLNKLTTYKQLKELSGKSYDVFVNLCEGYLEWDIPSIDVIHSLEMLNLPYTGPNAELYDPPKDLMKYVAYCEGVKTPPYYKVSDDSDLNKISNYLKFPMFVKPIKAGDSLGIDDHSKVDTAHDLYLKIESLRKEYNDILIEEYIPGREFTVLVVADESKPRKCRSFKPVEYIFPENFAFKTYSLKTSELHPEANKPCDDKKLDKILRESAERIFKAFNGVGYARMDFRVNDANEVYFLEINFTCSVFYSEGYEGSADYILKYDGVGQEGFLRMIVEEGIKRYKSRMKKYEMKGNAISGFGIYAKQGFKKGEVIFKGEERAQRIVTKRYVGKNWTIDDKRFFKQYAYPLSNQVYCLWDNDPTEWAPQNHSCDPNTEYKGLDVIALREVQLGEELTLDYSNFLDEQAESFVCQCNSPKCKGVISGVLNNSVTKREDFQEMRSRHRVLKTMERP